MDRTTCSRFDRAFEYVLHEHDNFGGARIAATEDEQQLRVHALAPSTSYTFERAELYDALRKLSDAHFDGQLRGATPRPSAPSNRVSLTTPGAQQRLGDFATRSVEHPRWLKNDQQLELSWTAPETFCGRIRYEVIDVRLCTIGDAASAAP